MLNSLTTVDEINMAVIGWQVSASSIVSSGQTVTVSSGVTVSNVEVESGGTLGRGVGRYCLRHGRAEWRRGDRIERRVTAL